LQWYFHRRRIGLRKAVGLERPDDDDGHGDGDMQGIGITSWINLLPWRIFIERL
jgi:hypothetical protein